MIARVRWAPLPPGVLFRLIMRYDHFMRGVFILAPANDNGA